MMLGRISSLFFNLGLHIGLHVEKTNNNMYDYLFGFRYSRSIFNPIVSLSAIRKIALFFLLSSKLNKAILPIIRTKETLAFVNYRLIRANKKRYVSNKGNINISDLFRAFALRFFKIYKIPVLLNRAGLIGWWLIYYNMLKTSIYGHYHEYKKKGFKHLFSIASLLYRSKFFNKKKELKQFLLAESKKISISSIITLLSIFYIRLYDSLFGDVRTLKFRLGRYIRRYRKFFAFFKLLLFLRRYTIFPNIVFYLNPTNSELRDIKTFRVCSIALTNSNIDASIPFYPVPINNSTSISKIFFCNLFVHFYYMGRILLILSII